MAVPVMKALAAENAMQVETAGGRSIIVQSVAGDTGKAEFDRAGRIIPLSKGVRLTEGDVLHTEGDKKVYLAVDNTTVLRLEENSEAAITRAAFGQKLTVNLTKGRMFYNVAKQESGTESLELMSNNITIAIRGTSGILSVGNGRVQHQLYDGTVEVYEGETKFVQTPGQMLETCIGPANSLAESTDIKGFTIRDIPASVAQEMLADQNLMERILSSLPLGDMADRVMDILDGTFFKELIESGNDKKYSRIRQRQSRMRPTAPSPQQARRKRRQRRRPPRRKRPKPSPHSPHLPRRPGPLHLRRRSPRKPNLLRKCRPLQRYPLPRKLSLPRKNPPHRRLSP